MKILVVASHPDDEVLGCGGIIAKQIRNGAEAHICILGEGVKSRDGWTTKEYDDLHVCIENANNKLGVLNKNIHVFEYPDNRFDSVPLLDIVKTIGSVLQKVKPDMVFTHSKNTLG